MHLKGVVHRDMNPTNVFLVDNDNIKILDFNVSKLIEKDTDYSTDEDSKFKYSLFTKTGTPIYTAPEMHSSSRYSESVDLWGVGCVLYTMLLGEPPFFERSYF